MRDKKLNEEKRLQINSRSNYESFPSTHFRENKKKNDKCCYLIILSLLLMSFLFICGSFYNFITPYKYDKVFNGIQISSRHNLDTYLPIIDFKIEKTNIRLEAKLVSVNKNVTDKHLSYFNRLNTLLLDVFKSISGVYELDYKKNSFFKLNMSKLGFRVKELKTPKDDIQCYNLTIKHDQLIKKKKESLYLAEACLELGNFSWFGGHESLDQPYWPINNQTFSYVPYVTGYVDAWGALYERYWLSSSGLALFFDDDIPLFVNHLDSTRICFKSDRFSAPYQYTPVYSDDDSLNFVLCKSNSVIPLHMHMIKNYLNVPTQLPDSLMMKYPVFTTWNYYFKQINQSIVIDFAKQITANNYTISQLEIDDKWEQFYGDLDFDITKFPDVKQMVEQLHEMNMRCTLWVHPFTNIDSINFVNGTRDGFWVLDADGQHPGLTSWWNGKNSAILDTTNPNAVVYFTDKLNSLKSKYGIDSFKFDAGETSWVPHEFKFSDSKAKPDEYSQNYARLAASQNNFVEVRTGHRNQEIGIFYRILDRATDWTIHDGIKSVITATLQFSLLGYSFVLPDIVGGNGDPDQKNKELFIRWAQLTAFLPAMQFGVPPWFFDEETNKICKKFVDLHETMVYPYMRGLPLDGQPLIRPMFWLEPDNQKVFTISDQFVVGDQIIVAPVVESNATARQVYLPKGSWWDYNNDCNVVGPVYLNYKVTLESIPFFLANSDQIIKINNPKKTCLFK